MSSTRSSFRSMSSLSAFTYRPCTWPDIIQERLAYLKEDDTVIDLLCHIPYIRRHGTLELYQIYYGETSCNEFNGAYFYRFGQSSEDEHATEPFPSELEPHVVTLAQHSESGGYYFFHNSKEHMMELVDYIDGELRERGVKKLFQMPKDEFHEMSVPPVEARKVYMVRLCDPDEMDKFKEVLRRYGWPTDEYKKEACIEELEPARQAIQDRQYSFHNCYRLVQAAQERFADVPAR